MINPINTGRRDAVSLRGIGGAKASPSGQASAAMGQVAARLAATLAHELRLADTDRHEGFSANDAYGVEELAAELNSTLGGSPADQGRIARSLHEFARESATLVVARPGSHSLERLQGAIVAPDSARGGSDVDQAVMAIDDATARLQARAR